MTIHWSADLNGCQIRPPTLSNSTRRIPGNTTFHGHLSIRRPLGFICISKASTELPCWETNIRQIAYNHGTWFDVDVEHPPYSPNLPFPMGFPIVKHDRFHRFPVRLDPPVGFDRVVLNRFFSVGGCTDARCTTVENSKIEKKRAKCNNMLQLWV